MEFCPKCGAMLVIKRKNAGCPRCDYNSKSPVKLKTSEKLEEKKQIPVLKDKDAEVHPEIEQKCPECGNKKAYFWTMQTRSSDESETKFYKCTKCDHTWREYR